MKICKDCLHYEICDKFGCFEIDIGDNIELKICKDFKDKANFKEVVRGEWINCRYNIIGENSYEEQCSICQEWSTEYTANFCPHCVLICEVISDGK